MDEEQEQQIGNIRIKATKEADMKVYKCPHLNCSEFFTDYTQLQSHLVLGHAEVPRYFNSTDSLIKRRFCKQRLGKQNLYVLKMTINSYKAMLDIFLKHVDKVPKEADPKAPRVKV